MIKNIKMLFLVSLTIMACTTKEDEVVDNNSSDNLPLTAGSANFSKYVAVGNSLTAGFSDNALFIEGQKTSWSNILAQQFKLVGGGDFKIPFMADNVGGLLLGTIPLQGPRLFFNGAAPTPVSERLQHKLLPFCLDRLTIWGFLVPKFTICFLQNMVKLRTFY